MHTIIQRWCSMIKLLVNFRKDGQEYKKGQKIDLSLKEEQEFIKAGYAESAEAEKVEILAEKQEGIEVPGSDNNSEPGEKEEEEYEEIKLTYGELNKKNITQLEAIAADNNIKLTASNKKDKILELIEKLTAVEEI